MRLTRIGIAAALLMSSGAVSAQTATDAQCLLLSNAFGGSAKDADSQKTAQAAVYFYLGRIGDRMTAAQLKALFGQASKSITQANAGTLMDACVKNVQTKMDLVQSVATPAQPKGK